MVWSGAVSPKVSSSVPVLGKPHHWGQGIAQHRRLIASGEKGQESIGSTLVVKHGCEDGLLGGVKLCRRVSSPVGGGFRWPLNNQVSPVPRLYWPRWTSQPLVEVSNWPSGQLWLSQMMLRLQQETYSQSSGLRLANSKTQMRQPTIGARKVSRASSPEINCAETTTRE